MQPEPKVYSEGLPINLHCHSFFSVDGWASPEAVADAMAQAGIRALSLTDHNTMDGVARCAERARAHGMRFIPGIEFDALWQGREYHLLAFGFDPDDSSLRALCARQYAQYAINFDRFLPILERRFGLDRETLAAALPERYPGRPGAPLNKWFARGFLVSHGLVGDPETARKLMSDVAREAERDIVQPWDWCGVETVRDTVHAAGGILLLAHPANYLRGDLRGQVRLLESFLTLGLDGFELYHPSNMAEPHFQALTAEAQRLGCALSGGSDAHFASPDSPAGKPFQAPDWLLETFPDRIRNATLRD